MSHQHDGHESPPSFWSSRYAIGYVAIGAVAAYFLGYPDFCVEGGFR